MTTTTTELPDPLAGIACPDWCTLRPGHPVDSELNDVRGSRGHGGPGFGPYLSAGADELTDAPGVLHYAISFDAEGIAITEPSDLLDLARDALSAAQWLAESRR